jgi:hypothetical protein
MAYRTRLTDWDMACEGKSQPVKPPPSRVNKNEMHATLAPSAPLHPLSTPLTLLSKQT